MTKQSEALRLADELLWIRHTADWTSCEKAAAELRRLHAQRDALLAALRDLVQNEGIPHYSYLDKGIGRATATANRWLNARAAIRAVEE